MKNTNENVLKIENLSISFEMQGKKCRAIRDLNLTVNAGELVALVGESGCGKTLCASFSMGLGPVTASLDGGSIFVNGQDMSKATANMWNAIRGKDVAMIFQEPMTSLNPLMKVGKQIAENAINRGVPKALAEQKALEMMRIAGLPDPNRLYHCYPHQLSGGQRQRVSIAIALILNPSFVVCDEAVSALDVSVQAQILNLLHDLQEKFKLTYLFISHNLNVVSYMSDRIGVMYLGSIVELGDAVTLSQNPLHPYTKMLFSSSINVGGSDSEKVQIKGELPSPSNPPSGCTFHTRCPYCTEMCSSARPTEQILPDGRQIACHYAEKFYKQSMEKNL